MITLSPTFNLSIGSRKDEKALDRPTEKTVSPAIAPAAPSSAQHVALHLDDFQLLLLVVAFALAIVSVAALVHEIRA